MEYDYAVSLGIPTLGFLLAEGVEWPREKSDTGNKIISKLNAFKKKVKSKPVSFWQGREDLYGKCSIALMKSFNTHPRDGWVRASTVEEKAAAAEVVRLSTENANLRKAIDLLSERDDKLKSLDHTIETLKANKRTLSVFKKEATNWEKTDELNLYQIFETVAPELQVEVDLETLAMFFATHLAYVPRKELRTSWPMPRNQIRDILADFAALNCIIPSQRQKPVDDKKEYWCLGNFGIELLAYMRRRRLENVERQAKVKSPEKYPEDDKDLQAEPERVRDSRTDERLP
jgi:hypothetical protein